MDDTNETSLHLRSNQAAQSSRWPKVRRRIIGVACSILGGFAILAAAGATYETIASAGDASAYPPVGRLIDIGGYRLHLDCRGEGTPTVVMDAGLGGSSLDWVLVQARLSATTRVCSYDRAGMGWSDAGPLPRSPGHIADELHALLKEGAVPGPYVLVAHSLAGKNVRMFALAYPAEVAGMVLVDARSERVDAQLSKDEAETFSAMLEAQAWTYTIARRLGLVRLFGARLVDQPLLPSSVAAEMALLQTGPRANDAATLEGLARSADDSMLAAATLGSVPLVIIAAGQSMKTIPNWPAAQNALAALSHKGRLVVAEQSGHYVQLAEPSLVTDAVLDVLSDARNDR